MSYVGMYLVYTYDSGEALKLNATSMPGISEYQNGDIVADTHGFEGDFVHQPVVGIPDEQVWKLLHLNAENFY